MSRWGRGRNGSVAVPLDSALFRENSNCPSAARSAGTVGKWGITSFTSIRSAPYAYQSTVKKPVQDQNSPLTVPAIESEQPPPKPKKFFKSRNAEVYPPTPQITYAPPESAAPLSPEHSSTREKKTNKRSRYNRGDSSSPELPRRNSEKSRAKKNVATKASKKEDTSAENSQPPNKRYLVRNRNKVINYAEDGSNSPIPEFTHYESLPAKLPSPKASPLVTTPPPPVKVDVESPSTSKETNEERKPPPIVLRISKGTSRIVSTDSNEGFTSPSSDRHSSLDNHSDIGSDHKRSPAMESICSPKHEGLKITIKCSGLNQEVKKEKKKEKKAHKRHHKNSDDEPLKKPASPQPGSDTYDLSTHKRHHKNSDDEPLKKPASPLPASNSYDRKHKRQHKNSDDEPLKRPASPLPASNTYDRKQKRHYKNSDDEPLMKPASLQLVSNTNDRKHKRLYKNSDNEPLMTSASPHPGSDTYNLYKTLTSPVPEVEKDIKNKQIEHLESQLAQLDSNESESPVSEKQLTEPQPEPKPPEKAGRSRRNRPNINYSENDDEEAVRLAFSSRSIKTVSDLKKEARRSRRKQDTIDTPVVASELTSPHKLSENEPESQTDQNDLIDILSGSEKTESTLKKTKKQKNKKHSPKNVLLDNNKEDVKDETPREESNQNKVIETQNEQEQEIEMQQEENNEEKEIETEKEEVNLENEKDFETEDQAAIRNVDPAEAQIQTQSSDSAYNSCPNELSEEESQKCQQDEVFKSPEGVDSEEHVADKPSVKLVITKKKGSIFKSKSLVNDNPSPLPARKRRHLYKHAWANEKGNETPRSESTKSPEVSTPAREVSEELTRVTRYKASLMDDPTLHEPIQTYTSVRCNKEAKEYYTVVRNVKKAHQIQEIGEFQEFNDDVEYLLDACQDNNPISTRCLSAITLASKCTAPAFRMHLRAHGTVQKFFTALHDATNDQSLGLCTATVMFVLSQDRLNMDLDRESLELMLNLLESDVSHKNALDDCGLTSAQLTKTQERVRELCAEIKSQGKAKHLDLENITVGHLAMETLLSLTSKRAGEWFKEELRNLGGVDHIVRTIQDCATRLESPASVWTSAEVDVLRKADRCMRVLENVTQQNEANQQHLVTGSLGAASTLTSLLRRCVTEARTQSHLRLPLLDAALPAVKVLVNLSHSFGIASSALGAQVVGEQPSVMEICLLMLNNQGNFIPDDKNFDFCVCVLMLLINLVQNNDINTQRLLSVRIRVDNEHDIISRSVTALDLIMDLFYKREELARRAEENTDALLDGKKEEETENDNKKQSDDIDETVTKLLARAGTHMEHTMVGAYIALLVGNMAVVSATHAATVRARVPSYEPLLPTLKKYFSFLSLTASAEAAIVAHVKTTQRIIQFMETSDKENSQPEPVQPAAPYTATYPYYQTSPSDVPQDMSLSNLNYSMNYMNSTSSSDRMSSSMEIDGYH